MVNRTILILNRFLRDQLEPLLTLAAFLLALVPRMLGLAVFWTADEPFYYDTALSFGRALKAADWAGTLGPPNVAGVPSVTTRWLALAGIGLGYVHRLALRFLGLLPASSPPLYPRGLEAVAAARVPGVVLTALVVAAVYVILRRTVGRRAACIAAVLLALDPFYIALSRVVGNDALHASFALLAVLAVGLTFVRGDRRWIWVFGACAGLAFLSKSPALVLLPLLPVLAVILNFALLDRPRPIVWSAVTLAIGYVTTAATAVALWPAFWVQPVATLRGIFEFSEVSRAAGDFFLGRITPDPGPLYYPIAIAFRLNPFVMLGLVAALVAVGAWLRQPREMLRAGTQGDIRPPNLMLSPADEASHPGPRETVRSCTHGDVRSQIVWTVLLGVFAVAYLVLFSVAAKKSDRYGLPIILACDVIGALGLSWLADRLAGLVRWNTRTMAVAAGAIVVAYGVYTCAWAYPYYFPAYNPLLGGLPAATHVELVGWGEGIDRAAAYLNSRPNASSLMVGGHILISESGYFHGPRTLSRPRPLEQLDYYVDYIAWRQRDMVPLGFDDLAASTPPEYVVDLGGVPYVALYRIPKDRYRALPDGAAAVDATYAGGLRLAGYRPQPLPRVAAGPAQVPVSLYWQADASCTRHLRLKVSLVNGAGTAWGDRSVDPPCGDPNGWQSDLMVRDDVALTVLPGTPPGEYALRAEMIDTRNGYEVRPAGGSAVMLGSITLPQGALARPASLRMEHALDARLGDAIRLLGYDVAGSATAGETLTFTAYWECLRPVDRTYRVFIDLLDGDGNVVAEADGGPADGFYPTDAWAAGDVVRDPHRLTFADDRAADAVGLEIGLYDPASGERLPVTLADDERPVNRAVHIGGR